MLNPADLAAYLARIGFSGKPRPDLATLRAVHRAHALAIPFENADVQFGRAPGLDGDATFAKLVSARRGGWCYEHNALLGRALEAIGLHVTRLSAGVMRQERGDFSLGTHLALKVGADGDDWLCDVGFGAALIDPLRLADGRDEALPVPVELTRTEDGYWRLAIAIGPAPFSYDFRDEPADEDLLSRKCEWQGHDPQSPFVQNLVVQRRLPAGHVMLRGKVLTRTGPDGRQAVRHLAGADDLVAVLREDFSLDLPQAAGLWETIRARHAALFDPSAEGQPAIPTLPTT